MTTKTTVTVNESSLRDAVVEYIESVDRLQCHVHLRVDANGNAYVDADAGYCVSDAEFNRTPGHARTVKHQSAHGQCNLADDWTSTDEGIEEISATIESIVADLEREGFEVELI